jgi:ribosome-associated protein
MPLPDELNWIAQTIFDKKGMNILCLDMRGVSSMADFFMIAEGTVERHVSAIAQAVVDVLEKKGIKPNHVEGLKRGDWIVIDYVDIVVHLLETEVREHYGLEEIWRQGKVVSLKIDLS